MNTNNKCPNCSPGNDKTVPILVPCPECNDPKSIRLHDNAEQMLAMLELNLKYLYKMKADDIQTVIPVVQVIRANEKLIETIKGSGT